MYVGPGSRVSADCFFDPVSGAGEQVDRIHWQSINRCNLYYVKLKDGHQQQRRAANEMLALQRWIQVLACALAGPVPVRFGGFSLYTSCLHRNAGMDRGNLPPQEKPRQKKMTKWKNKHYYFACSPVFGTHHSQNSFTQNKLEASMATVGNRRSVAAAQLCGTLSQLQGNIIAPSTLTYKERTELKRRDAYEYGR